MADAIPSPSGSQPKIQPKIQSTVVVPQPMSQWDALKAAGWWRPYDWAILSLLGFLWVTGLYWAIFGHPGTVGLIALLLINMNLMLVWLISLIYRCSWFVLRLNADVATLPTEAARIAVAYLAGKTPPTT